MTVFKWIVTQIFSMMSAENRDALLDELEGLHLVLKTEEALDRRRY